jgi:alpha-1,2-mannosyltransferase
MSGRPAAAAPAAPMTPRGADRPTRRLRRLCIAVVGLSVAEFLIATTGVQIRRLPISTDFATYYLAGAQARDGLSPYDQHAIAARGRALGFGYDQFPFLYPPPFALAMQPLARLAYPRARQVWMAISTASLLALLGVVWLLLRRQAAALGLHEGRYTWILFAAFVPAALNSTSVHNDVRAGSVGCLLGLALAWAALGVRRGGAERGWAAGAAGTGAALALATLVKLTPLVFVAWAAWRGARRAALVALGLLALAMLAALAHWGAGIVPDHLARALLPSALAEAPRTMNQSLDGFLSRLFVPSEVVASPFDAPGFKRLVSVLLSIAIGLATLQPLRRADRAAALLPVEMGAVLLALLVLMKLTWMHTLAALLFVWPVLMLAIVRAAERGAPWAARAGLAACSGFFLSSAHLPILWAALQRGPAVVLTGAHLAGMLLLWGVALVVLQRQDDVVAPR